MKLDPHTTPGAIAIVVIVIAVVVFMLFFAPQLLAQIGAGIGILPIALLKDSDPIDSKSIKIALALAAFLLGVGLICFGSGL